MIFPIEIKRLENAGILVKWSDLSETNIKSEHLRKNCPCATCNQARGDKSHAAPLTAGKSLLKIIEHTKDEEIDLKAVWAIGNYALGIRWGDGHDSGIYTYQYLRELVKYTN